MKKVAFWDKRIISKFWGYFSVISGILSFLYLFHFIPDEYKKYNIYIGLASLTILVIIYISLWICSNRLKEIKLNIDGCSVIIKEGDIFKEDGYKAISFNEYFDTKVDNKIISEHSLNGIFIKQIAKNDIQKIDKYISIKCDEDDIIEREVIRKMEERKQNTNSVL